MSDRVDFGSSQYDTTVTPQDVREPIILNDHTTALPGWTASTPDFSTPEKTPRRGNSLRPSWLLLAPLLILLFSLIAIELMPACTVDIVHGTEGCGVAGDITALLVASGFFWLVINTLIALPLWKALSLIIRRQAKHHGSRMM